MAWRFGCQQHRAANSNSGLPDPSHKWAQGKGGRRRWHPTPVLLPGKSHGRRSLVGCSPWGREESDTTERLHFHFHALEKEMATHSSVLAWRIPGTGEPGGLPSMGSHRVGHDWSDLAAATRVGVGVKVDLRWIHLFSSWLGTSRGYHLKNTLSSSGEVFAKLAFRPGLPHLQWPSPLPTARQHL